MDSDNRCCPHVDGNDPRCGSRFTLGGVEDMFHFCCGGFHGCAMFHRINMEVKFRSTVGDDRAAAFIRDRRVPAIMQVTANGRNLSICATGS
ncbi:MAG: hypothetical protein EXS00_06335 [Phycisphaerales bacterium]|nr:hypothetical protein [Phycisphaerales bacterium]